jgi:pilus assembly protein CpaD
MSTAHRFLATAARGVAIRLLAIAGGAAMLAGCYTDHAALPDVPNDYRQRHPIVVREGVQTVELFAGTKRADLTADQRADVLAFAHRWRRESAGGILIDMPAGTANAAAAAGLLNEIRSILLAAGVPPQGVEVRPYRPADPRTLATIRLNYPRMVASAGPCGLWPHDLGPTFDREHNENLEYWNFGCAAQRNLAATVENPADLIQPRGEMASYTPRRTTAFERYREGIGPATIYANPDKGKITDIGNGSK